VLPRAIELTFFRDTLERFPRVLDAILIVFAIGRKQLDYFVASTGGRTADRTGGEINGLTDLKPVIIPHAILPLPSNAPLTTEIVPPEFSFINNYSSESPDLLAKNA
jgi:hypothetical protein